MSTPASSTPAHTLLRLVSQTRGTVIVDDSQLSGPELVEQGRRVAGGLADRGLDRGDGVLLVDDGTGADLLAGLIGCWWLGARATVIPGSSSFKERVAVADESGPTAVITALVPSNVDALGSVDSLGYADLRAHSAESVEARCEPADVALEVATSGTTGAPKCVSFSHVALYHNVLAIAERLALSRDDVLYAPLPLSLAGVVGMALLPGLAADATVHLGRLEGARLAYVHQQLARIQPTVLYGVPYFFEFLARSHRATTAGRLRWAICSSAPLPPATFERVLDYLGVPPRSSYCLAEAGTVTLNTSDDLELLKSTVGEPLSGLEVTFEALEDEPAGTQPGGRIIIAGRTCGLGYRRAGRLEPFPAGVVRTQDRGKLTGAGLTVLGRVDDVIQVAGHNVDLAHVRRVLQAYPGLKHEHAVVVEQHAHLGAVPILVVEASSLTTTTAELLAFCRRRLRDVEVPREVRIVGELVRTASGKVRVADGRQR